MVLAIGGESMATAFAGRGGKLRTGRRILPMRAGAPCGEPGASGRRFEGLALDGTGAVRVDVDGLVLSHAQRIATSRKGDDCDVLGSPIYQAIVLFAGSTR
jgi:hypothetical protein